MFCFTATNYFENIGSAWYILVIEEKRMAQKLKMKLKYLVQQQRWLNLIYPCRGFDRKGGRGGLPIASDLNILGEAEESLVLA